MISTNAGWSSTGSGPGVRPHQAAAKAQRARQRSGRHSIAQGGFGIGAVFGAT